MTTDDATTHEEAIHRLKQVAIPVAVNVAEKTLTMRELLGLAAGDTVPLGKKFSSELVVCVNHKPIALGKAVKVGGAVALEVTQVKSPEDIVRSLGPS